jgi:hypothetical protein
LILKVFLVGGLEDAEIADDFPRLILELELAYGAFFLIQLPAGLSVSVHFDFRPHAGPLTPFPNAPFRVNNYAFACVDF